MSARYFVETPISAATATLTGSEAHHLLHVMRAGPGAGVVLFDGSGHEYAGVVGRVRRNEVDIDIRERKQVDREVPFVLALAVALPKGDRQRWLVEKAVELGVTQLTPLVAERSVAQPTGAALDRLRRTVIEASKQCGRNVLMELSEPQAWPAFSLADPTGSLRWLAHPAAPAAPPADGAPWNEVRLAIGPEGGWTDDEVGVALQAGWAAIDLGPRILRVETAAVFLVAKALAARDSATIATERARPC